MKKKVRIIFCMSLVVMLVLGMSSTAFAATYAHPNFKSNYTCTAIATKASAQQVYDYNSYFRRNDNDANTYYKSRPCNSDGGNVAAYETNFSGGSNLFTTSYTSIRMQIDNYAQRGIYCRTSGTFGGTY